MSVLDESGLAGNRPSGLRQNHADQLRLAATCSIEDIVKRSPWRWCALPAVVGCVVGLATPVSALDEVTTRSADASTMRLVGRGFGHGRGMSQWGAYGAAQKYGLSWTEILAFYYPGTTRTRLADGLIKVWISGDRDGNTTVLPTAGLTVSASGASRTLPVGRSILGWRAVRGRSVTLQYRDASRGWRAYNPGFRMTSDVAFSAGPVNSRRRSARAMNATVRLVLPNGRQQELRGILHATQTGSTLQTILHSTMESYLRGVVPNEMPASWHPNALSAQSVAARTYAAAYRDRSRARKSAWDVCDTVSCQVFYGVASYSASGRSRVAREHPRTTAAIAATSGVVLSTGRGLANTEFSASNGGYTVASGASYIVAKRDPYDGAIPNGSNSWTTSVLVSRLEGRWGLGKLKEIRVQRRDGNGDFGGRVDQLQLVGDKKSVTLTGAQLRSALGLKSTWFAFPPA